MLKRIFAAAFLAASFLTPAISAEFTYTPNNQTLTMVGDIVASDLMYLYRWIYEEDVKTLRLTSPGGDFYTGINLGIMIHENNIDTVVSGDCYSSCAYMWLAGDAKMYEIESNAVLGIHMPAFFKEGDIKGETYEVDFLDVGYYIASIDLDYNVAYKISRVPNDSMWVWKTEDIEKMGLVMLPWKDGYIRSGR